MTDKQRLAKLERAEVLLKKTQQGYHPTGTFWQPAMRLINEVQADLKPSTPPVTPTLVFPMPKEAHVSICQGLHETGGLPGNWAIDFCCIPGTAILSPERATVTRFSGSAPDADHPDPSGVFGWTTYLQTPGAYVYFITHQGRRLPTLKVGMRVEPGDVLGFVGDQKFRPDHAHIGVSSPHGQTDAKKRIVAVSKAPRIH